MRGRVEARLAQLQHEQAQTQQALATLEQQRQGLLQQLIGQTYAVQVLQEILTACAVAEVAQEWEPVAP